MAKWVKRFRAGGVEELRDRSSRPHSSLSQDGRSDGVIVSGWRTGRQARLFVALPTQSTWTQGDDIYNKAPIQLGSTTNIYTVPRWLRVTDGTGNVLNTDWCEERCLTRY